MENIGYASFAGLIIGLLLLMCSSISGSKPTNNWTENLSDWLGRGGMLFLAILILCLSGCGILAAILSGINQ